MTTETDKIADKVAKDLVEGELVSWAVRPEVTRTIRKTLHKSHVDFVKLNNESYTDQERKR